MSAWPRVPLREIGTWYGGGTPSKSKREYWEGGDVPWLSPKDMGGDVIRSTQDHITEAAIEGSSARLVPANSVVLVVRSGILERRLPVARVPFETTLNQDMKAIKARDDVDPRWIALGIRAFEHELLSTTRKAGTTVASIETSKLQAFALPVPPLDEQRRIVEILEDHLSRLDAADKLLRRARFRAKRMHAAVQDSLVWADGAETAAVGDLLREKMRNGHSARAVEGTASGIRTLTLTAVTLGSFTDRYTKITSADAAKVDDLWLRRDDILIQRANTPELVGTAAIYDGPNDWAIFPDLLIRVRVDEARVRPRYVALALAAERTHRTLRARAKGLAGSMPKVDQRAIAETRIPLPSLAEQDRILLESRNIRDGIAAIEREVDRAMMRSVALRRSLMSAAFSGQFSDAISDRVQSDSSVVLG